METEIVKRHFERMGAHAILGKHHDPSGIRTDVRYRDGRQCFILEAGERCDLRVVDLDPSDRHLLLLGVDGAGRKNKFLCGHDEREWFVAGVPDRPGISGVRTAKEALKPAAVLFAQNRARVPAKARHQRRNKAFVRQGEWFFLPVPWFEPGSLPILRHEPLMRTGGKPHMVDELVRTGGEPWYVSVRYPNGVSASQYRKLIKDRPHLKGDRWRVQRRNAQVIVRGAVRHRDHATVRLRCWHQVLMNTEHESHAMRHVAFID